MAKHQKHPRQKAATPPAISSAPASRGDWVLAGLVLVVAALFPLINAALPILYDEHYTLREYASSSFRQIATTYDLPNNHIGFTWVLRAWLHVLDAASPRGYLTPSLYALRLPVITFALLACTSSFLLARRVLSRDVIIAALATLMMIAMPVVAYHSFQLRGYMPSVAYITTAMAVLAYTDRLRWFVIVPILGGAVFLAQYTLPTNIWFLVPLEIAAMLLLVAFIRGWIPWQPKVDSKRRKVSRPRPDNKINAGPDHPVKASLLARAVRYEGAFVAVITIPTAIGLALLCWLRVWDQLQAQNNHKTTSIAAFFKALGTHTTLLAEGAGPLPSMWINVLILIAGTSVVLWFASRGSVAARRTLLLVAPMLWLSIPVAAAFATLAFSRNFTIAAPAVAILFSWLANIVYGNQTPTGAPGSPRRTWISRAILASLVCITLVNSIVTLNKAWRSHRPDEAVAAIVKDNHPQSIIVHEAEADALAIDYYAYRAGRHQPVAYDVAPPDLCRRVPTVYLLAASDATMAKMIDRFGIKGAPAERFQKLGQFGIIRLARYSSVP